MGDLLGDVVLDVAIFLNAVRNLMSELVPVGRSAKRELAEVGNHVLDHVLSYCRKSCSRTPD